MLLTDITINGTTYYLSDEYIDRPEQFYDAKIVSFSNVTLSLPKIYGGFAGLSFGTVAFLPDTFNETWPPPVSIDIKAYYTESRTSDKLLIFDGKLHRNYIQEDNIGYTLYSVGSDKKSTDKKYSGSFFDIFQDTCDTLGFTLNTTKATDSTIDINYTAYGEKLELLNLSDLAASFGHCFYISENTLYLIDMNKDNDTAELTEFEFFPSRYVDGRFYSLYKGLSNDRDTDNEFSVTGTWDYGDEYRVTPFCRDTPDTTNAEAMLTKIKEIHEKPRVELKMPINNNYSIGQKISFTDESKYKPLSVWFRIRSITWNFGNDEMVLQGEGSIEDIT
jgi:hypothetical protein